MAIKTRETTADGVTNNNAPLTNAELDNNFVELQQNKVDSSGDSMTGNLSFGDNDKAIFGAGSDLQIYHDGDDSYIQDAGTGNLLIRGANVEITTAIGTKYFDGASNIARLYHTGNPKLATTSTGIDVTGTVTADGLTVDELTYPSTDGTAGQVLKTDGAGNIGFSDAADLTAEVRHSIRPSLLLDFANSKTLDPRIDFTRSSTATYYDGKTHAKAEENVYKNSQEFTADSYYRYLVSVTDDNATAPDGTTTAAKVALTGAGGYIYAQNNAASVSGETQTVSFYVKAGNHSIAQIAVSNSSNVYANIDLSSGTIGDNNGFVSGSLGITDVGNGWYRVYGSHANTSTGQFLVLWIVDTTTSTRGQADASTGDYVYTWGWQAEYRDSVTAYTPTTSQPITNYIPVLQTAASGTARFDHDPVTGESKGLLIEEQRTNLISDSDSYASLNQATVDSGVLVSPEGTLSINRLITTTADERHIAYHQSTISLNGTYTYSVVLKKSGYQYAKMRMGVGGDHIGATVDLDNGTITADTGFTATIQDLGNGFYRCSISKNLPSASYYIAVMPMISSSDEYFIGDGWSGLYFGMAQLEAGSFPTSYIPTSGSQVTRSGELGQINNIDFADTSKGTLYAEYMVTHPEQTQGYARGVCSLFNINSGSSYFNSITLTGCAGNSSYSQGIVYSYGSNYLNQQSGTITGGVYYKNAIAYAKDDGAYMHTNKASVGTDSTVATPDELNTMRIGSDYFSDRNLDGCIKKIAYYPARLTNAEITALTED